MSAYVSNLGLDAAAALMAQRPGALVVTHAKPDGDAFGAVVALTQGLRRMGKQARAVVVPPIPAGFLKLRGAEVIEPYRQNLPLPDAELVVMLDTGAWAQVSPLRPLLEPRLDRMLILDHHTSGDVPAAWRHIDPAAAACCEIVADVLDSLWTRVPPDSEYGSAAQRRPGEPGRAGDYNHLFDPTVCDALFLGIASDTGWFRFSNTRARTHDLAWRLLTAGVNSAEIYRQTEQNERPQRLALMARALASLQLLAGGRAALMVLRADDFAQTGGKLEETERFVDLPQAIGSVELVILATETPRADDGERRAGPAEVTPVVRLSFRSKPVPGAVDVAALARHFGGGGHARAAGAKVREPLAAVLGRAAAAVEAALSGTSAAK